MRNKKNEDRPEGPRWFESLVLPPDVMDEMRAAVEAEEDRAELAAREVRERERDLCSAASSDPAASLRFGYLHDYACGLRVQLLDERTVRTAYRKIKTVGIADKERTISRIAQLEHIASRGCARVKYLDPNWSGSLAELRRSFANFGAVLDLIEAELELAYRSSSGEGVFLPPLLLNGPPGCGKTFFAQNLAEFFQTGFVRISMESAQTAAEINGTAEHWSNTQPGRIFDKLIEGDHINPVVLLDEVDKSGGYESHRADKALYSLLERESAKQWSDLSFPALKLDTSHIVWLLTSNDARSIPSPLRSRMQQFDIPPLNAHAARQLVRTLYRKEVQQHPDFDLDPELAIAHCDVLRCFSPREIVRLTHALVARVAMADRRHVTLDDLRSVGALDGRLVEFERHFGRLIEWTTQ